MLNPKLIEIYGDGVAEPLSMLIDILGDQVASTIYIASEYGCINVNGVKIPNSITTESAQVNYVENCIKRFLPELGCGASDETIEVWTESLEKGDIPLCVSKSSEEQVITPEGVKIDFNAATIMGGE